MDKIKLSFAQLEALIRKLFENEEYERIIQLIDMQGDIFPDKRLFLTYWQMGMAARLAKPTLAFHFMDELLQDNLWVSPDLLIQSPSFTLLREMTEFEVRLQQFAKLQAKELALIPPVLTLKSESECDRDLCPLFIGLHGEGESVIDSARYWHMLAQKGWLVGLPQSTQAMWSNGYTWDNLKMSEEEILGDYQKIIEKYQVDKKQVVLGGQGLGGEMAIWLATKGIIPATGIIVINPKGPILRDEESWPYHFLKEEDLDLRGVIISTVEEDLSPQGNLDEFVRFLQLAGMAIRVMIVSRKQFDSKFQDLLAEGFAYLFDEV